MRYRLRTLLVLLGILPPAIAGVWLYPAIFVAVVLTILCLLAALLINDRLFAERKREAAPMFRFTIRDVLWLMVVVAVACGWYIERNRLRGVRESLGAVRSELSNELHKVKVIQIGAEKIPELRGKKMLVWFTEEGGVGSMPAPEEKSPSTDDRP